MVAAARLISVAMGMEPINAPKVPPEVDSTLGLPGYNRSVQKRSLT